MKEDLTELQTFGIIEGLGGFVWHMNHDAADGRVEWTPELRAAVKDAQETIERLARSLIKFGVEEPVNGNGPTKTYREWYAKLKQLWYQLDVADQRILIRDADDDAT